MWSFFKGIWVRFERSRTCEGACTMFLYGVTFRCKKRRNTHDHEVLSRSERIHVDHIPLTYIEKSHIQIMASCTARDKRRKGCAEKGRVGRKMEDVGYFRGPASRATRDTFFCLIRYELQSYFCSGVWSYRAIVALSRSEAFSLCLASLERRCFSKKIKSGTIKRDAPCN